MPQSPRQLLDEYRRQYKIDSVSADKSLLDALRTALEERLQANPLEAEDVHVAVDFSLYFGEDRSALVQILYRYLSQPLTVEEEAWAQWKLVDNLALLERCSEVVASQRQFLAWARQNLACDQLLWVMYDSTQALCWVQQGLGEEWLQIFHEMMAQVTLSSENRKARLIYLETASVVLNKLERPQETLQIARMVHQLSEEEPEWERNLEAQVESLRIAISAYGQAQNFVELRAVARKASGLLEEQWQDPEHLTHRQKQRLMVMFHNLGSTLYLTHQYDLAVPMLRRAVEFNSFVEHTYLWLAASLWVTTKDRSEVLSILRQGAHLAIGNAGGASLGYDKWKELPEFSDVANAPDFLNAVQYLFRHDTS